MRASPQGSDPPAHASQLPKFLYNQHTKHVVDPNAPFEEPSYPSSYTPNPLLQVWRPNTGVYMHPAEKWRLQNLQEVVGHLYAAIGQNEKCDWPNPVEGESTTWSDLHYFGKALALLETAIAKMALTKEEGLTAEEANMELGIGSHAFTTTQRAAIGKRVGIHRKAEKLLPRNREDKPKPPKEYPKPRFEQRHERDKVGGGRDLVCWTCGKKGHVAAKCRSGGGPAPQGCIRTGGLRQGTPPPTHPSRRTRCTAR